MKLINNNIKTFEKFEIAGTLFSDCPDIEELGFKDMITKLNGIFTLAYKDDNYLYLARDRQGIMPLYIYKKDKFVAWSNFVKDFHQYPEFDTSLDPLLLKRFVWYALPTDLPYKYVTVLPSASYMKINLNTWESEIKKYWDRDQTRLSLLNKYSNDEDYKALCEDTLKNCIKQQIKNDNNVGIQLSGGVDSTLIAKYAQDMNETPLHAYALVPDCEAVSEKKWIDIATKNVPLNCHNVEFGVNEFIQNLEYTSYAMEKCICYHSMLGIYTLSKAASKQSNILLCGEGADELFYGYTEFSFWKEICDRKKEFLFDDNFLMNFDKYLSDDMIIKLFGNAEDPILLERRRALWNNSSDNILYKLQNLHLDEPVGGVLEKQFKISVANGIEPRLPFLDNDMVDFSFTIPENEIFTRTDNNNRIDINFTSTPVDAPQNYVNYYHCKDILKKLSTNIYGHDFAYRKKTRIELPISWYLTNSTFREYFYDVILEGIKKRRLFDYKFVENLYLNVSNDNYKTIWQLICFELWLQLFVDFREPLNITCKS